jgi:hypothetical protein
MELEIDGKYGFIGELEPLTKPASLICSENWSSGEANRQRGRAWLDQIYKANHAATENTLAAHKDFCE